MARQSVWFDNVRLAGRQLLGWLLVVAAMGVGWVDAKEASVLVTAEMRARAVENSRQHPWAKKIQAGATAAAKAWLAKSDEELAAMVTSQELPRALNSKAGVLYEKKSPGCPKCGEKILAYQEAWKPDPQGKTWKLQCPSCGEIFPKNDFAAFYATALDEHGCFRRDRGDRSLLFNAEHPDPSDPLHKLYVDDGYGMQDERGEVHHIIARYNDLRWMAVRNALGALVRAYTYTDDVRYAHKAAVLLDRIADVYPDMDYKPLARLGFQHNHGGPGQGRVVGSISECAVSQGLASAYDRVYDGICRDKDFAVYDARKAERYALPQRSGTAEVCRHIEKHLLLEILRSCKDRRIDGNLGMTHTCTAVTALALDDGEETPRWLDWLFGPSFPGWRSVSGGIPGMLMDGIDADGMGGECGKYGLIWSRHAIELGDLLASRPRYSQYDMVKRFPKLKQCFFVEERLACLDAVMPPIGDACATGLWYRPGEALRFAIGFKLFGDPRLAELAWRYADGKAKNLRQADDIFQRPGESLADRVEKAAADHSPPPLRCDHLGRYGLAVLQTHERDNGRAVWIHFGQGKGHSHSDVLNLGLYAKNVDMLPDLGYPAYTGKFPERIAWTSNTISHNTLQVGDTRSGGTSGGKIRLLADAPPLRVIDVACPSAYSDTAKYRRQVAMIDVGDNDSYVVDVFVACGGVNHRLSWHGPSAKAVVSGVELVAQGRGTFAGGDTKVGQLDGPQAKNYEASGFTYLYDVHRSQGPVANCWTADWKAEDRRQRIAAGSEPHLRIHGLTPCDELAMASGDPPKNKEGNPARLRYVIQSRLGSQVASQFVTVLEPYERQPFIRRVRALKTDRPGDADAPAAVAVELANGDTDVVILCQEPMRVKVDGRIELDGQVGMVRFSGGKVTSMRMVNGRRLSAAGVELRCETPIFRGKVAKVDATDSQNQRVYLDPPLPSQPDLLGRTIHFDNDVPWDTSFDIAGRGPDWVSAGEISLVRGFKVPTDFHSGYQYTINAGDRYEVPVAAGLDW
jgi:hypothetical protein